MKLKKIFKKAEKDVIKVVKEAEKRLERTSDRIETHNERKESRNILDTINTQLNNLNTAEKITEINTKITNLRTKMSQLDNNAINLPAYSTINICLAVIDQFIISMTQAQESITTASSTIDRLRGEISDRPKSHPDTDIKTDCANMLTEIQTAQTFFTTKSNEFISYYNAAIPQITTVEVLMEQLTTIAAAPIINAFRQLQQQNTEEPLPTQTSTMPPDGLHLVLRM